MSDAQRLQIETLKLLVQVAWADHEIAPEEVSYIIELARQANASPHDLALLGECLDDKSRLPAPDIGFLRQHSEQVLREVANMITIDRRIVRDEIDVMNQLRKLLGGT